MRIETGRQGGFRMSGLQLPEAAAADSPLTAGQPLTAATSLAVSQMTTYGRPLEDDLDGLLRAGIGGIGLYRPTLAEHDEDFAIDLIRSSGLAVSSLSWVGGFTGSDGSKKEEALFDAEEAIRFAAAVAAGTVCVAAGGSGNHIATNARRMLVDALRHLSDVAADLGVRLSLQPLAGRGRSFVTTLEQAAELVDVADRANVGLVYDVGRAGAQPGAVEAVPAIAERVHVVKLSDRNPRAARDDGPLMPGDGTLPIDALLAAFVTAGYAGPFEIDVWSESLGRRADYDRLLATCRDRFDRSASAAG